MPDRRKKRFLATTVMIALSLTWIAGSVFSFVVLLPSAFVEGGRESPFLFELTNQIPTVSSSLSFGALIGFPVLTLIGFIFGWPHIHDDDYPRAIGFNLAPTLSLLALWIDGLG